MNSWSVSNFYFGDVIGEGAFGKVYHAKFKQTKSLLHVDVAIKAMDKTQIMKQNKIKMVLSERNILSKLSMECAGAGAGAGAAIEANADGDDDDDAEDDVGSDAAARRIVKLYMSFMDRHNLYLVQELCMLGTLTSLIEGYQNREQNEEVGMGIGMGIGMDIGMNTGMGIMHIDMIRNISGQIVSAMEYMHSRSIVHCDLKPDNIMLSQMHKNIPIHNKRKHDSSHIESSFQVKIVDFGSAMDMDLHMNMEGTEHGNNGDEIDFVGTSDYISPEVIRGSGSASSNGVAQSQAQAQALSLPIFQRENAPAIDLWAFGCIVYFMIQGVSPFHDRSDDLTLGQIIDYARLKNDPHQQQQQQQQQQRHNPNTVKEETMSSFWENKKKLLFASVSVPVPVSNSNQDTNKALLLLGFTQKLLVARPENRLGMGEVQPISRRPRCEDTFVNSKTKMYAHANVNTNSMDKYRSIRSDDFYFGFDWSTIDNDSGGGGSGGSGGGGSGGGGGDGVDGAKQDRQCAIPYSSPLAAALQMQMIDTDIRIEDMEDGARLPFDFFA